MARPGCATSQTPRHCRVCLQGKGGWQREVWVCGTLQEGVEALRHEARTWLLSSLQVQAMRPQMRSLTCCARAAYHQPGCREAPESGSKAAWNRHSAPNIGRLTCVVHLHEIARRRSLRRGNAAGCPACGVCCSGRDQQLRLLLGHVLAGPRTTGGLAGRLA